MMPVPDLSAAQIAVLADLKTEDSKKKFRGIWYMAATLTPGEMEILGKYKSEKQEAYLHYLCKQCDEGKCPCYELTSVRKPEITPEDLDKELEAIHDDMENVYGTNGALLLGVVTSKAVLPTLEHTIAAFMIGYPPTLLASQKLTKKIHRDRDSASAQGVDLDAVILARTLIETGQIQKMKAIMIEGAKGTDLQSPTMLEHLTSLKVSQQTI